MTCFSARNFARGDNSKHGIGIFVGKITATSGGDEETNQPPIYIYMALKDLYILVRTNTTRVKIDDQCDILVVVADSMVRKGRLMWHELRHFS